jgi:putative solute:sodium symporter small subunit
MQARTAAFLVRFGGALRDGKGRLYSPKFGRPAPVGRCRQSIHENRRRRPPPGSRSQVVVHQEEPSMQLTARHKEYWNKNLSITGILLMVWFVATFVLGYFARDLSFNFFGWPFAFYMAAQGSLIIYVVIIWYYARYMNNLDREYDVHEGEDE